MAINMTITQLEKHLILNELAASSWGIRESCTENDNRLNNKNSDTARNIFRRVVLHHRHSWKGVAGSGIVPGTCKRDSWPLEGLRGNKRAVKYL